MEAWRLKIEPWRVCRPVNADLHHFVFDEEQDPDPEPHQSEKSDPDLRQSKKFGSGSRDLRPDMWSATLVKGYLSLTAQEILISKDKKYENKLYEIGILAEILP